ncbi:MAG: hypothetical protein VXW11_01785, partial [Pseudomonadota bacterium]|nr:hypothetical protein [Pseudomonadota bacterium]
RVQKGEVTVAAGECVITRIIGPYRVEQRVTAVIDQLITVTPSCADNHLDKSAAPTQNTKNAASRIIAHHFFQDQYGRQRQAR